MNKTLMLAMLVLSFGAYAADPAPAGDTPKEGETPAPKPEGTEPTTADGSPAVEDKKDEKTTVTAVMTPEQLAALTGVQFNVTLDHSLGAGTFIDSTKYAYLQGTLDVSARYAFAISGVRLAASGRGTVMYEYTPPDASNGRRVTWRDLSFGLSAPALYKNKFTGINVTPSLSLVVPITPESWQATMITVLGAGVGLNRVFGPFIVQGSISGSRSFFASPQNGTRRSDYVDAAGNSVYIGRTGESYASVIGNNATWGLGGGLSVTFLANDELSFYASYSLRVGWRNAVTNDPNDPYNPQGMNSNGEPVADVGMGRADTVITSVGANYQLSDHWALTAYIFTAMPPRTADGKNFRFPFWAFEGAANNYSYVGLSLSAGF